MAFVVGSLVSSRGMGKIEDAPIREGADSGVAGEDKRRGCASDAIR